MSLFSDESTAGKADHFSVLFDGLALQVREHELGDNQVFHVQFPDGRKPLVITKAIPESKRAFWTSVPQGRQQEAERIGALIVDHFKNK